MTSLWERLLAVVDAPTLLLFTGETGVGKSHLARLVHFASRRHAEPFVEINCAALPPPLLESELWGHERAAFTGATERKPGLFEAARGGTIFLDEIGELPPALQPKLLLAVDTNRYRSVGSVVEKKLDARLMTATNQDLRGAVKEGSFRGDLYYRVCGFPVRVPALRERRDDIRDLARGFAVEVGDTNPGARLEEEAYRALEEYDYPGNIRQLRYIVGRAARCAKGATVTAADVLREIAVEQSTETRDAEVASLRRAEVVRYLVGWWAAEGRDGVEREVIREALAQRGGSMRAAAKLLGWTRTALTTRCHDLGIVPDGPRSKVAGR